MSESAATAARNIRANELGLLICKHCNQVIGSLPTDGFKKIYIVCQDENCGKSSQGGD